MDWRLFIFGVAKNAAAEPQFPDAESNHIKKKLWLNVLRLSGQVSLKIKNKMLNDL